MTGAPRGRILVVEDDESIRAIVELALTDEGHEVLTAEHGDAALGMLDANPPDVILLDMKMPVMDGWEFARHYRQRPGVHAPIIVMTAAKDASARAAEIGATGCLSKPFDLDMLVQVVNEQVAALGNKSRV